MKSGRELVFVYGALRRGASHAWRMERGEFVGDGSVRGTLHAIDWYPGVVLEGEGEVRGELFWADDSLRAELDTFEGIGMGGAAGDEYERVRVPVRRDTGETVEAWIYLYRWSIAGRAVVPSGDWVASGLGGNGSR